MNTKELESFLIHNGRIWVQAQWDYHRPGARALTDDEKTAFLPFFGGDILNATRVSVVPIIENPAFYATLPSVLVGQLIDFTKMAGITFLDTILVSRICHPQDPPARSLLFHELVHVVQYQLLGRDKFVEEYIQGWMASDHVYDQIPLEKCVFALESRYNERPLETFSVEREVRRFFGFV